MTLIEGVGDEVTQFFVLIVIVVVGFIAWWSTSTADQPLIRTVLILERRARRRQSSTQVSPSPVAAISTVEETDTGQVVDNENQAAEGATCEICAKDNAQSSSAADVPPLLPEHREPEVFHASGDGVECNDSDSVRRRRLAFFQNRQETLLESSSLEEGLEASDNVANASSEAEQESPNADNIRIRLKYLNDDQKLVQGRLQEQLGDFKRRHFSLELSADKLVRLIFNGHVLQSDGETLESLGLFDNCVVHCLVHQQRGSSAGNPPTLAGGPPDPSAPQAAPARDWDLGNVLFGLLTLALLSAWYCRFQYSQLFNATTTVALAGLTGIFGVSLVGLYMPDQDGVRQQ